MPIHTHISAKCLHCQFTTLYNGWKLLAVFRYVGLYIHSIRGIDYMGCYSAPLLHVSQCTLYMQIHTLCTKFTLEEEQGTKQPRISIMCLGNNFLIFLSCKLGRNSNFPVLASHTGIWFIQKDHGVIVGVWLDRLIVTSRYERF